jgi:hypothetical protein
VGDRDYKTDQWLRFLSPVTNFNYEKFVFASSHHSQLVVLSVLLLMSLRVMPISSFFEALVSVVAFGISMGVQSPKWGKQLRQYKRGYILAANALAIRLGLQTLHQYHEISVARQLLQSQLSSLTSQSDGVSAGIARTQINLSNF